MNKSKHRWRRRLIGFALLILPLYVGIGLLVSTFFLDTKAGLNSGLKEFYTAQSDAESDTIKDTMTVVSWNLMQAAAGSSAHGGSEVSLPGKPSNEDYNLWWSGIRNQLDVYFQENCLMLLQNISSGSSFSYGENQLDDIEKLSGDFPHWHPSISHQNRWCPIPLFSPGRRIATGIGVLLPKEPRASSSGHGVRRLRGGPSWPRKLWQENPYYLQVDMDGGLNLEILNVDLSPENDSTAIQQMLEDIQIIAMREYEAGDHVILGGDWGMMPPFFRQEMFSMGGTAPEGIVQMPADWLPADWTIVFDPMIPTMRSLKGVYNDHTPRTTTDFFICSPNVRVMEIHTVDMGFRFSNHQPVQMKVILQ